MYIEPHLRTQAAVNDAKNFVDIIRLRRRHAVATGVINNHLSNWPAAVLQCSL